jgi:hypothetical protein
MATDAGKSIIETAKQRFHDAKTASADQREDYRKCMRMTFGDQWDAKLRSSREKAGRPALSFPVLHTYVQRVTNQARKERPQPKVNAVGGGASQEVAEVFEGLLRHVHTASAADVAYDTAVECAGAGGWGYYEFTTEYVDDTSFNQEPRIRRVLDPLTIYFDPNAIEPDYSDAKYYFKRRRMHKDEFKREFGVEADSDWGDDDRVADWIDGDYVYICEYCYVDTKTRELWQLQDGTTAYADEIEKIPGYFTLQPVNKRKVQENTIKKCIIDGARVLEETVWLGRWLPMVPVLGKEVIVDDKRKLFSVISFALDSQKLVNATGSGVAEQLQLSARAPFIGAKGSMKDKRWDDNTQNWSKLEYEPFDDEGRPLPPPQRNAYEAPVQALTQSLMLFSDNVKRAVGYVDTIQNPSQADLSGIAVQRREAQSDLTNSHFEDNLVRSQWHGGRILLDLIKKYIDTPRAMRILAPDGSVSMKAITMAMEPGGEAPKVAGYEGKPHVRIDVGQYDVTISTGPSYTSRLEAETDALLKTLQADPNLWAGFADVLFKLMGYPELEQRAKMLLPPAIQEAIANQEENISPEAQAKIMQLAQKLQQAQQQSQGMAQAIQKLMFERQAKIIESETKVHVAAMDNASKEKIAGINGAADVQVQSMKHGHDTATNIHAADQEWDLKLMEILRDFALTPDPNLVTASKLASQTTGSVQ